MRAIGWVLVVLGVLGVGVCAVGVYETRQAKKRVADVTQTLAAEGQRLLDIVDRRLEGLTERFARLVDLKPGTAVAALRHVQDEVDSARHTTTSILSLTQALVGLVDEGSASSDRFPEVASIATTLEDLSQRVAAQAENLEAWMLRPAAFARAIRKIRTAIADTRTATQGREAEVLSTLDLVALGLTIVLVWMGLGQVALARAGRRFPARA